MKKLFVLLAVMGLFAFLQPMMAQPEQSKDSTESLVSDTLAADSAMALIDADLNGPDEGEGGGLHKAPEDEVHRGLCGLYVFGGSCPGHRSCFLHRAYHLSDALRDQCQEGVQDIDAKLMAKDVEGAKDLCRQTRGPVASICYQGLMHIKEPLDQIDRQLTNYGSVQISNMEKGCTWIKLFIAVGSSLGFLGTVIGMVMAFDQIQTAGDISPTIVASGMKVALITTIFGIIVAIILQFFYNYILAKIERLTAQMEESAITFMDSVTQYQSNNEK